MEIVRTAAAVSGRAKDKIRPQRLLSSTLPSLTRLYLFSVSTPLCDSHGMNLGLDVAQFTECFPSVHKTLG